MIKILIVDDQPAVRRGLRMCLALEPDMTVVDEAADGEAAVQLAQRVQPDLVLMDVMMPRMDGIRATALLRRLAPRCPVVLLSLYDDAGTCAQAQAAGAAALIRKQGTVESLLAAIRAAAATPA